MSKYQIGERYWLKVFSEPEEMQYLGEIKPQRWNCNDANIIFEVFERTSYGKPDIIALYKGEFFVRTYDGQVDNIAQALGNLFTFEGKGYTNVKVGSITLPVSEFQDQVKDLLTEDEINTAILKGRYITLSKYSKKKDNSYGEVKWCPKCEKIRQTGCSACGCGSCEVCDYRWCCMPPVDFPSRVILNGKL